MLAKASAETNIILADLECYLSQLVAIREGYNKEQQQGGYKSVTDFVLLQNYHLLRKYGCISSQCIEISTASYSFTSIRLSIPIDST